MKSLNYFLVMLLLTGAVVFSSCEDDEKQEEQGYTFHVTVPEETGDADVCIAFEINGGEPSAVFKLTKSADGKYSIIVTGLEEGVEYLYILDEEMEYVEMSSGCEDKTPRKIGTSVTINDTVENWKGVTCIDDDTDDTGDE